MKGESWRGTELEGRVVSEIVHALRDIQTNTELSITPSSELCSLLERFLPQLLRQQYPKWRGESLDGVFVARARKASPSGIEIVGTCILMSDQTLAPLLAAFEVVPSQDAIASFNVSIGEPGGGPLGISGPPCNSGQATRLQQGLAMRFDFGEIEWVYRVASNNADIRQNGGSSS
jgi:hypothetical protein